MTDKTIDPIDFKAIAAKLKMQGSCTTTEYPGVLPVRVERFATCAKHPLTIALTQTKGPYSDSQPKPILTLTHRATGLALYSGATPDCVWPATAAGLLQAKKVLRETLAATTDVDWSLPAPLADSVKVAEVQAKIAKILSAHEAARIAAIALECDEAAHRRSSIGRGSRGCVR